MIKHTMLALTAIGLMSSATTTVSADETARLKGELTPFGAEKAGNKDGSIPAWAGGYTTPIPGFKNGGKRADPFAADKPLYQVTARNMAEHADRLTEGVKAMLKKYPDSFRVDVYPTRRTAAAPQWVYDNTACNVVKAELKDLMLAGVYGGIFFLILKSSAEAI